MTQIIDIRVAEFNNLKETGKMTSDAVYQIVVDSQVPLTVNEISALFSEKTGRILSREYMRARLDQLVAVNKVASRPETPSEMRLRSDIRGGAARLFFTESTPQPIRVQLPSISSSALRIMSRQNVSQNKRKAQRRAVKTTNNFATDSLAKALDALYADRTVELEERIAKLEARLAQIARLAR